MKVVKSFLVMAVVGLAVSMAVAADDINQPATQLDKSPIKGKVAYTFFSDYIWHGINLTKTVGGHEGTGASVMDYGLGLDLAELSPDYMGTFWVTAQQAYFNRYDGTDASLAKTDLAAAYTVACPFMDGDWTLEYRNINFNEVAGLRHADGETQEVSAQFAWNDGNFFKSMTGEDMGKRVLHPTIKYMYDYDQAQGGLLTLGLAHPFDLADVDPALTGLTLTPSPQLVVDNRYYGGLAKSFGPSFITTNPSDDVDKTTKIAYTQINLDLAANLSKMMNIKCGKLVANTGIGYVNSVEKFLDDTLYGYVGISYNW